MRFEGFRKLAVIVLLLGLSVPQAYAQMPRRNRGTWGQATLTGRIIEINQDHRFVIINLGSADGLKNGIIMSVFQKDEEAAKIKVSKVRRHISACDIQLVYTGRGIGVGDIVIYKEASRWRKMLRPLESTRMIEIEPIVVDIDAPKRKILKESLTVFKEFGVVVSGCDPSKYAFQAHKNFAAPLNVELITEWGPYVRNKVYYDVEVRTTPRYNRLVIRLRGVYDSEGQLYNHEIKKTSSIYREAQEIAFSIKDLAEKL